MRILIVSDIHGNRAALDAIQEPYDVCLCLGDVIEYGPDTSACIEWTRSRAAHCIRGNHDHGAAQGVEVHGVAGFKFLTMLSRQATVQQLTSSERRYLADLPTSVMVAIDGKKFLLVHASPRDPLDEYVPNDPQAWAARTSGLDVDFVCVGHTHSQFSMPVGRLTVLNPGSVGLQRDGDPRAKYAIIENGVVKLKRIQYDVDRTIDTVRRDVTDPKALQMLTDVYRMGRFSAADAAASKAAANGHPHHTNGSERSRAVPLKRE